ncbi:MAG: hypothetical protein AB7N76_30835 [Planctomycetota bacterium]
MFFLVELESLFSPPWGSDNPRREDPRARALAERISRAFRARGRAPSSREQERELHDLDQRRPGAVVLRSTPDERALARRVARAFAREHRVRRLPRGAELQALATRRLGCVRGA